MYNLSFNKNTITASVFNRCINNNQKVINRCQELGIDINTPFLFNNENLHIGDEKFEFDYNKVKATLIKELSQAEPEDKLEERVVRLMGKFYDVQFGRIICTPNEFKEALVTEFPNIQ